MNEKYLNEMEFIQRLTNKNIKRKPNKENLNLTGKLIPTIGKIDKAINILESRKKFLAEIDIDTIEAYNLAIIALKSLREKELQNRKLDIK